MKLKIGNKLHFLHQGIKEVESIEVTRQYDYGYFDYCYNSFVSKGFNLDYFWNVPDNSPYRDSDFFVKVRFKDGCKEYLHENYVMHNICLDNHSVYFKEPYCKNQDYTHIDFINQYINQETLLLQNRGKTYPLTQDIISFIYFLPNYVEVTTDLLVKYFCTTLNRIIDYNLFEAIIELVKKDILYIYPSNKDINITQYKLAMEYRRNIDKALAGVI